VLPGIGGAGTYRLAMRTLHLVESDLEAGRVVLSTSDGQEKFELPIDQELRALLADAKVAPARKAPTAPSGDNRVPPREIQMRIRAGATPAELAEDFGADLDWVLRFAAPVLAERERIANEARRGKARRSTTEGQIVVFGEAVDERFAAHGIEPQSVGWDAHRREDGQWVLTARWIGGRAERTAEWTFQLSGRTVAPLDDTAADLLSDRPIRPVPVPEPPAPPTLTVAPPVEDGLVTFPAMPDAHTGPLPRAEEVFDQARFEEPQLPMNLPEPLAAEPSVSDLGVARRSSANESEEDRAARASIPSWDDILLGVRRKRD
jgi:hypothetical protein